VRLVELDAQTAAGVRVAFGTTDTAAREVNGQEQPVASTAVSGGALSASFSALSPRTFPRLVSGASIKRPGVQLAPVTLKYDLAAASTDGTIGGWF